MYNFLLLFRQNIHFWSQDKDKDGLDEAHLEREFKVMNIMIMIIMRMTIMIMMIQELCHQDEEAVWGGRPSLPDLQLPRGKSRTD